MPGISGIIGNLIQANQEKKSRDLANQANTYAMIYKMPDEQLYAAGHDPQQMHNWALENLMHLGEKNVDKEHKQKIPVLGTMLSVLGGLRNLNPVPGAPKPYAGKAPERQGPPPREEDVEKYKLDKRLHQEQQDATVATQVEKDMQGVAEVKQKNAWKADLDEADHDAALVKQGRMTQDQADERQRTRYGVGAKQDVKPSEALHFKLPSGKIMIVHPRPGGGFMDASGKTVTLPEGAEEIDKPAADKPVSVAEENRHEVHSAYAQLIGKRPGDLTTAEQQKADQWSKEDAVTKKRVDINMRKGMKFPEAWAKAQEAEVKLADTRQTAAAANVNNAATSNAPMQPATKSYLAGLINAGKPIPYGLLRGMSKQATANLLDELPRLAAEQGMTVGDVIAKQADVKALGDALAVMQRQYAQISSFEHTASMNLDRAIGAAGKIGDTGSPLFNKPFRKAQKDFAGKPELAAYEAARVTAFTEVSKVLSGATGTGAATEGARHEAEEVLKGDYTLEQLQSAANMLKLDMATRTGNMRETIEAIKGKIAGKPAAKADSLKPPKAGQTLGADTARKYMDAAGGDKEKARAAAAADGWSVK